MQFGYTKVSQHFSTTLGYFSAIVALLTSLFILSQKKKFMKLILVIKFLKLKN